MTFSEYTLENTPINARPDCPLCAAQMYLARIEPEKPGHDLRTFECPRCQHVETAVVASAAMIVINGLGTSIMRMGSSA
jgi:hypothetical protein